MYPDYPFDMVLFHAGHNHNSKENPIDKIVSETSQILQLLTSVSPDANILLDKVVLSEKHQKYSYLPELNRKLE
jgi:hypothetical protein